MKFALTFIAAASLVTTIATYQGMSEANSLRYEQEVACTWFPVCRDPDFHQEIKSFPQGSFEFDSQHDVLISCTWFPVCRDPDMPFHVTDEQSEAVIA